MLGIVGVVSGHLRHSLITGWKNSFSRQLKRTPLPRMHPTKRYKEFGYGLAEKKTPRQISSKSTGTVGLWVVDEVVKSVYLGVVVIKGVDVTIGVDVITGVDVVSGVVFTGVSWTVVLSSFSQVSGFPGTHSFLLMSKIV